MIGVRTQSYGSVYSSRPESTVSTSSPASSKDQAAGCMVDGNIAQPATKSLGSNSSPTSPLHAKYVDNGLNANPTLDDRLSKIVSFLTIPIAFNSDETLRYQARFENISLDDMEALGPYKEASKHRCIYDADTTTLLITCTTSVHDRTAQHIGEVIANYIRSYSDLREYTDWHHSYTQNIQFEEERASSGDADFAIFKDALTPYFVVEIAFSQIGEKAVKKCVRWVEGQPSVVGAVVVNIEEQEPFRNPPASHAPPTREVFDVAVVADRPLGAAITVKGHDWFKPSKCTVEVLLPRENRIESFSTVLIPYAEESAINELNGALGRLAYLTARVIAHDRSPPVAVVKKDFPGLTLGGFREMYLQSQHLAMLKRRAAVTSAGMKK